MPRSTSSRKRVRQNLRRRARNRWRRDQVKQAVRAFEQSLASGEKARAADQLRTVYRVVDKMAAKGTIHKNAASRRKARLALRLARLT